MMAKLTDYQLSKWDEFIKVWKRDKYSEDWKEISRTLREYVETDKTLNEEEIEDNIANIEDALLDDYDNYED